MASSPMNKVVQHLRRAVLLRDGAGLTDGQLLGSFIEHQDEPAFAALVHRHGPMVWSVCRRVLGNHHDAEDAFQATFLVLVHKASTVFPRENVANWLYGVAYRTSLKARTLASKRKARERQLKEMPDPRAVHQECWHDLQSLLDQELNRLPDKFRLAIILCDLERKTYKEAARQLGCPEGTFAARLARARAMLAKRLRRHGLVVSAGTLGTAFSQSGALGAVPTLLMNSTLRAASLGVAEQAVVAGVISIKVTVITKGVLHTMLLSKLKSVPLILLAVGLALGAGGYGTGLLNYSNAVASEGREDSSGHLSAKEPGEPKIHQEVPEQAPANPEDLRERVVELKQQLQKMQKKIARLEKETQSKRNERNYRETFLVSRFKYRIPFETGYTESKEGGRIEIQEVWGTRPRIEVGGLYLAPNGFLGS